MQFELTALELADEEEIVDKSHEPGRLILDLAERQEIRLVSIKLQPARKELRIEGKRGDRIAQFVPQDLHTPRA